MRNLTITTALIMIAATSGVAYSKFAQAHADLQSGYRQVIEYRFADDGSFSVLPITAAEQHAMAQASLPPAASEQHSDQQGDPNYIVLSDESVVLLMTKQNLEISPVRFELASEGYMATVMISPQI